MSSRWQTHASTQTSTPPSSPSPPQTTAPPSATTFSPNGCKNTIEPPSAASCSPATTVTNGRCCQPQKTSPQPEQSANSCSNADSVKGKSPNSPQNNKHGTSSGNA